MKRSIQFVVAVCLVVPLLLTAANLGAQDAAPAREWYLGKVLFKSNRDGGEAIYAMNPDGSGVRRIGDANAGYYYAEALRRDTLTADGRYRLFVRLVGGDYQIWQEGTTSGWLTYIAGSGGGTDYDPVWAPDTRYVAYVSQADGNDEIHLLDRKTGQDRRLTSNTWEWDKHPSFSPDGSQIVFWSNRQAEWKHIWIMGADGSSQRNLSGWEKSNDWDPVWVKQIPSER